MNNIFFYILNRRDLSGSSNLTTRLLDTGAEYASFSAQKTIWPYVNTLPTRYTISPELEDGKLLSVRDNFSSADLLQQL